MAAAEVVPWTSDQAVLWDRAKDQGVVVDLVLVRVAEVPSAMEAHREAVFVAVSEFSHRRDSIPPATRPAGGRRIAVENFYGGGFEHRAGNVAINSPRTPGPWGFAEAFMEPPYGQLTRREAERLFREVNAVILGSPSDETEVWEWPTDWAEYFEAGNDWVGAAAWSVGIAHDQFAIVGYSPIE